MNLTAPRLMLGSAALAALLMTFALRSTPSPEPPPEEPPPPAVEAVDFDAVRSELAAEALRKADRERLPLPKPVVTETIAPAPPVEAQAAGPVQDAPPGAKPEPEPVARHHASGGGGNLCTRNGMRLVWVNSKHWRCRK